MGIKIKIIGLCILSILMLTGCGNGHSEIKDPIEEENSVDAIEILVDGNVVSRSELVDIIVEATLKDGEKEIVTEGLEIFTDLTIDSENCFVIPEEALTGDNYAIDVVYKGLNAHKDINIVNFLSETIDSEGIIIKPEALDMVVNKSRNLPLNYVPEDLVHVAVTTCLSNEEVNQLRKVASDALTELFKGAEADGLTLVARSGYRSYNTQTALYNGYVSRHGQEYADKYSAVPGQSEHQSGLAMDITAQSAGLQLEDYFGDTEEGKWVSVHAHEYGFIIRYPEGMEDITGYLYEPWHLRYLGTDLATEVYESGLTLEEYFMSFEE